MKTHLVSQLLLRQFCINGKVKVHSRIIPDMQLMKPKDIAFIEVPEALFSKSEYKFNQIETRAATALLYLESGKILENETFVTNIKKLMVLHYVRSIAFMQLFIKNEKKYFDEFVNEAKNNHPESSKDIEVNISTIRSDWLSRLVKNIPEALENNIEKVNKYINQFDIEIGEAQAGVNFLLGDMPAVNLDDKGNIGILNGVGITNSVGFVMPLSPKYIVAFIKSNKNRNYRVLTPKEVGNCNEKLLKACINQFYTMP